jgi:hypothetical protein
MVQGPAPLFLIDANVRGAGKELAVDCAGIIATGERLATASYYYWHDDAEMRKAITSIAGDRAVLLDNIGGSFGVPCLDAALAILRGYVAAGRPDMKPKAWGTYEEMECAGPSCRSLGGIARSWRYSAITARA